MKAPGFELGRGDFRRLLKKSSFAAGALLLNSVRRRDFEVYYAFCRSVDDCADEYPRHQGRVFLRQWDLALSRKPGPTAPFLVSELHRISGAYAIPMDLHRQLLQGAQSDLRPRVRFATDKDLDLYCHRVAGVVGQACLPLFGGDLKEGRDYAEALGRAFQLINILRDVREDAARNRIYFALSDLRAHGLSQKNFLEGRSCQALLEACAQKAATLLERSDALAKGLPKGTIRPSKAMRLLYGGLLEDMAADGLRVFEKRYSLAWHRRLWLLCRSLL